MKVKGKHYQTIWVDETDRSVICVIDQRKLPFVFEIVKLRKIEDFYFAIKDMVVRGAPLIGVTGAFAIYNSVVALRKEKDLQQKLHNIVEYILSSRPTAINLKTGVDYVIEKIDFSLLIKISMSSWLKSLVFCIR